MTIEEIIAGESVTAEFKVMMPEKSIKYMKTVIAFANGNGGKIVFGVEDDTQEVVGISNDMVFKVMDSIANAISDSCEPMIVPDISVQEVEGKPIIVVEILPGQNRPYYIKSMGVQRGTYIRSAGTTRVAESYMIQELILERKNSSFDQLPVNGCIVTEEEIRALCDELTIYAKKMCANEKEREMIKPLTKNQLISWGLVIEKDGELVPSNGFYLLTGREVPYVMSEVQCAVFKGTNRAVFIDKKVYGGSIQEQIDEAYNFVLRSIRTGAKIEGLYRQDLYEMPIATVREMICNAICHRSYLEPSCVQVSLYDDRLEVTSPGMLINGTTIKKMKEGYSKIRNRGIANALVYMRIIERWGSGIPRMLQECEEYGLPEPELVDFDGDFRINLYRKNSVTEKPEVKIGSKKPEVKTGSKKPEVKTGSKKVTKKTKEHYKKILEYLDNITFAKASEIAELLGIKSSRANELLKTLEDKGEIISEGTYRNKKYMRNE